MLLSLATVQPTSAAEKTFDFSNVTASQTPPGFRSTVTGEGKPGEWRVVQDEVAPLLEPLTPQAPAVARKSVLAQLARDPADEHFPLLVYEDEIFGDFSVTTRFKTVEGKVERMAGLAFRFQNETNYYVVRASSLGNTFRFYKVVNGQRGTIIGPEIPVPSGVWHELSVECKGNQIRCMLNGKEAIPPLVDTAFSRGKLAFWTKSDSVSYFADTRINYVPLEVPAQRIVRDIAAKYQRLLDLKVYVADGNGGVRVVGRMKQDSAEPTDTSTEKKVLATGKTFYGRTRKTAEVVMPLRDRNGDVMAAVRVVMGTFPGQTESSAITKASPIVRAIGQRAETLQELTE